METTNLTSKKVSFHTLGCRLNFSESGSIAQGFVDRGYEVVEFGNQADVVFLNTCTVTDGADSTCRNLIRKAQASSPEAKIVVAGCYAQMEADKIKNMQGVDLILGTSEKYKVFDYLDSEADQEVHIDKSSDFWGAATTLADSHTRAFLKIQDGCNYVCSFCIIPFARGRSRTISVEDAIREAKELAAKGFKEIVLTGVNIGEYEAISGEKLTDLVKLIADIPTVERLRLGSVEPNTMTRELLETLKATGKYQDHFHIPMQSGSDAILTSMRRKYNSTQYKEIISMVRSYFPQAAFGADVIVGYPGETEEQFLETFNLLRTLPITHFHVFPYSKRKGTTASKMDNHIQTSVKKDRVRTLMMLGDAKLDEFSANFVGNTTNVLFENEADGFWEGYSSNYLRVRVKSTENLKNEVRSVRVDSYVGGKLIGTI
ncbi:tRNA (N(6)-L-threonylcarbamoyladenosine(37)-C(2))-methylthiotransferase MtaB [Peredibacter starrii]|uniref:Threonylcarbamoyladenosine tRNA methylthiotransferase MtaB n=1 Tax=Peredibacter starrii TaxID=28202 RepID=A0AAX4HN22_9BACT|nr:tRNA (N(6)-L-threonylcarbamoyladenosine(37)-C(2))-methylthiotransferase MtaB [Peredibacter starrii]WPU64723.1 tRNA (N(6)-L-threonylcarbamoyladenosine(37)-C(2))-methylthiotransferase MtaB [Peredibacter starrii]